MANAKKRARPVVDCQAANDGRTKQSFKAECDIHTILKQFKRTGLVNHLEKRPPQFLDLTEVPDYRTALNAVKDTEELFYRLPAKTRARFENDPALFLDFAVDPANESELRDLGFLPPLEGQAAPAEAPGEASAGPAGQGSEATATETPEGS